MEREEIYKIFLEKRFVDKSDGEINLLFDDDISEKEFKEEFKKFLKATRQYFFKDGKLFTVFNSYYLSFKDDFIVYMFKLFNRSEKCRNKIYIQFISEFLWTYYKSIESKEYKENLKNITYIKNKFLEYFPARFFCKNGIVFINTIKFYRNVLKFASDNNEKIFSTTIERIFTKFPKQYIKQKDYKYCFNKCIQQKSFMDKLVQYDYSIKKHMDIYITYIFENVNFLYKGDDAFELFKYLYNKKLISVQVLKKYLNLYIDMVNEKNEQLSNKEKDFIRNISEVDNLLNRLNVIKSLDLSRFSKKYSETISQCLISLLYYKRLVLADEEYVNSNMHKHQFEFKVPQQKLKIREYIQESILNLYFITKIDFSKMTIEAIKNYSDSPLIHLVSTFTIDVSNATYSKKEEEKDNIFKRYYEEVAVQHLKKNSNKYRNVLTEGYYENMLKQARTHQNLTLNLFCLEMKDFYNAVLKEFKELFGFKGKEFNNMYVLLNSIIIGVEFLAAQALKNNGEQADDNVIKNLERLFEIYCKEDIYRNGIMYIYYNLYDNVGLGLRHKLMHGNIINKKDFMQEFIIISGCYLFIQYLMAKEFGNE